MADMFVTRINVSDDAASTIVKLLNISLANGLTAQAMIKFAHWNVKGPTFWQTHKLFDEVFEKVLELTDDIGERIGSLGGIAESLPSEISANSTLSDYSAKEANSSALEHIEAVANVVSEWANDFRSDISICVGLGDQITADCLSQWAGELDHKLYFLEAHLRP